MTHSNHRQGTYSNLCDDFVVLAFPGRKFDDLEARLKQYRDIGFRHQPINVPGVKSSLARRHLVYDSREKVRGVLSDLATADLGLSIIVSGLRDQVTECCHAAGLSPHTVCQSLGFWGRTEQLPHFSILEITTMCGHGRVAPNLVWDLAGQVQHQSLSINEASRKMGKLCLCNIFNEVRAAKLMGKLIADLQAGSISVTQPPDKTDIVPKKDFGIIIDETKCIGCMECIPYCPVSAIVESPYKGIVSIDAERCTECGVCLQSGVCSVSAIVAKELTWPRTLRGKFHIPHAPYRTTPIMSQVSRPLITDEVQIWSSHQNPTEHTNDVDGLLGHGDAVVMIELGRPHGGTTFRDVEKIIQALIPVGLQLERQYPPMDERSPLTDLIIDVPKGILRKDILEERAGWAFLRVTVPEEEIPKVFQKLRQGTTEIDSIFAIDIVSRVGKDGSTVAERVANEVGVQPACNCKTNVGLGRPLVDI